MARYTKKVIKYLDRELDAEGIKAFEQELVDNNELKKELLLHTDLREFVLLQSEVEKLEEQSNSPELEKTTQETVEQYYKKSDISEGKKRVEKALDKAYIKHKEKSYRNKKRNRMALLAAAIVVVSMSVVSWYYYTMGEVLSEKKLYSAYYEPYQSMANVRGDVPGDVIDAHIIYSNGDYVLAIDAFSSIIDNNPNLIRERLYAGISCMEIEDFIKAKHHFEYILSSGDVLYSHHAEWYLALCYLKTDENDKSTDLFSIISLHEGMYQQKAKEIINHLKR